MSKGVKSTVICRSFLDGVHHNELSQRRMVYPPTPEHPFPHIVWNSRPKMVTPQADGTYLAEFQITSLKKAMAGE